MDEILPRPMVLDEFVPLVGQELTLDCTPQPVRIRLIEASPLRDRGTLERPAFILTFRSAPDTLLVDGAYTMRNETFGPDTVWIGSMVKPIGGEPGHYYQSIFN